MRVFASKIQSKSKESCTFRKIHAQLHGTMGGNQRHVINENDDDDVYRYSTNMQFDE